MVYHNDYVSSLSISKDLAGPWTELVIFREHTTQPDSTTQPDNASTMHGRIMLGVNVRSVSLGVKYLMVLNEHISSNAKNLQNQTNHSKRELMIISTSRDPPPNK